MTRFIRLETAAGIFSGAAYLAAHPGSGSLPRPVILARILAALVIAGAVRFFVWVLGRGPAFFAGLDDTRLSFYRDWCRMTALSGGVLFLWLAAQWPGFFFYDTFEVYWALDKGVLGEWYSPLFGIFVLTLREIASSPALVAAVQIGFAAVGAGFVCAFAVRYGASRSLAYAVLALFLLAPVNGAFAISIQRDFIFSWLHLASALCLPVFYLRSCAQASRLDRSAAAVAFLALAAAKLRVEALVVVPLLPVLLWKCCGWRRRPLAVYGVSALVSGAVFFYALPVWTRSVQSGHYYRLTAIVSPLSHLVYFGYDTDSPEEDRRIIDRVIDYGELRKKHDPYDIPAFVTGARTSIGDDDWEAFVRLYARMVVENPVRFLENRLRMFAAVLGFSPATFYVSDGLAIPTADRVEHHRTVKVFKAPILSGLGKLPYWSIWSPKPASIWGLIHASAALPLLILAGILCAWRHVPASAGAALVILSRLLPVFLTVPTAHFRYVYGLYLFGFFGPLLALAEYRARRETARASAASAADVTTSAQISARVSARANQA